MNNSCKLNESHSAITTTIAKRSTAIPTTITTIIIFIIKRSKFYGNERKNCINYRSCKYYHQQKEQQLKEKDDEKEEEQLSKFYINSNSSSNNNNNKCSRIINSNNKRQLIEIFYEKYFPGHHRHMQQQLHQQQNHEYIYIRKLSCIINLIRIKILITNNISVRIIIIKSSSSSNRKSSTKLIYNLRLIISVEQIIESRRNCKFRNQWKRENSCCSASCSSSTSNNNNCNNIYQNFMPYENLCQELLSRLLLLLLLLLFFLLLLLFEITKLFVDLLKYQHRQQEQSQQQQQQCELQLHVDYNFHGFWIKRLIPLQCFHIKQRQQKQQPQQQQQYAKQILVCTIEPVGEQQQQQSYSQKLKYLNQGNKEEPQQSLQQSQQQYTIKFQKDEMEKEEQDVTVEQEEIKVSATSAKQFASTIVCIKRKRPLLWWLRWPWQLYYYKLYRQPQMQQKQQQQQQLLNCKYFIVLYAVTRNANNKPAEQYKLSREHQPQEYDFHCSQYFQMQVQDLQDMPKRWLSVVNNICRGHLLKGFPSAVKTIIKQKFRQQQFCLLLTWAIVNEVKQKLIALIATNQQCTVIIINCNNDNNTKNDDSKNKQTRKNYTSANILYETFGIIMLKVIYNFIMFVVVVAVITITIVLVDSIMNEPVQHLIQFKAIIRKYLLLKTLLKCRFHHENFSQPNKKQNKDNDNNDVKAYDDDDDDDDDNHNSNARNVAKKLQEIISKRRPPALLLASTAVPTFSSSLSTASAAAVALNETVTLTKPAAMPIVQCNYYEPHLQQYQQQQQQQQCYITLFSGITSLPLISSVCLLSSSISLTVAPSISISSTVSSSSSSSLLRIFFYLILLSSLWHDIECFHGSVKLSANTVKTKYGLLRGIIVRSTPLVEAYLGIPYASPPVGSLRFMPPITPSTWKNVRNADRFSPVCPQTVPIPPNGPEALLEVPRARLAQLRRLLPLLSNQSEDCLYLNIYVPYENDLRYNNGKRFSSGHENFKLNKLSTILFIHGESYEWNSGNPYDGSELAAHGNVIVVTINFRLGIFGFLKTGGKESAQGNFGLMDLVAGLHWLKENLPAFGGDPQSITLLGHGTGAALANILIVSPVANDLVQRSVLVSGSALSPWAIQKNPLFVKRRVAEQTGCHGDMLYDDLAPCLRTKPIAELLAVQIDYPRFLVGFAPFIDGTVISPNTNVYTKLTLPLGSTIVSTSGIEYANFPKRSLIFCLTSVESHLDLNAQDLEFGFNETRRDRILRTYVRNNFHYHLNEIFAVVKNEYTDWEKAIRSPLSSRDATLAFLSDGHTASSLIKLGYMHNLRGGQTYFLHFKHRTVEEEYPQRTGSVRGEDVPFWLGLPISPLFPHNYTLQEKQISHLMLRYLVNFAKTGNPNQSSVHTQPQPTRSNINNILGRTPEMDENDDNDDDDDDDLTIEKKFIKMKRSSNQKLKLTKVKRLTLKVPNITEGNSAENAAREALNLAIIYNQRRTKRTYFLHQSLNDHDDIDHSINSESNSDNSDYPSPASGNENSNDLPYWDAYDVVNQLYLELAGNKAEIQSHYRGHKLSMWLNLIPQLHRHTNMNDLSMRHHHFQDDINHMNLYEGIVRPQLQFKPNDDDENDILFSTIRASKATPAPPPQPPSYQATKDLNGTLRTQAATTECAIDGGLLIGGDLLSTIQSSTDNDSLVELSRDKDLAPASTGLIGNLEVLRRLSSKQFQSYTTALVATVAVGCFLLILNILIFAGIYHQREKRARDAKTKEELQDNDTSKNSSLIKLNTIGSESGSFSGSVTGLGSKSATIVFGEYTCYDEKSSSMMNKDEKLMVELPIQASAPVAPTSTASAMQLMDAAKWNACSSGTLDLLKTKHFHSTAMQKESPNNTYTIEGAHTKSILNEHTKPLNSVELINYKSIPIINATSTNTATTTTNTIGIGPSYSITQINPYDYTVVQSSDQMSFQAIENAVKVTQQYKHHNEHNDNDNNDDDDGDDVDDDDDIPEPPPPPKLFQNTGGSTISTSISGGASVGGSGGGILRQTGGANSSSTTGGKKRVHIQEISV